VPVASLNLLELLSQVLEPGRVLPWRRDHREGKVGVTSESCVLVVHPSGPQLELV
jgi:hypothetical protein